MNKTWSVSDLSPSPEWLLYMFSEFADVCPKKPSEDYLKRDWWNKNYCNPPYSNKLPWIKKAIEEQKKGNLTVMLLPHDSRAIWYHDLVIPNAHILEYRGQLKLDNGKHPRYGSILAIFPGKV